MNKRYQDFQILIHEGKAGEQYTTCPKCSNDRKKKQVKCLAVNTDKEVWICHHCGWSGGLQTNSSYVPAHWNKPEYRKPKLLIHDDNLPDKVLDWFRSRGISLPTLQRNKVVYDKVYMPQVEGFVMAIGVPFIRDGIHVNTKWRDGRKNFRMEAGAERIIFGYDDIKDKPVVIWVEGEMDKFSLEEAGFYNVVSVPDGAPSDKAKNYESKFSFLETAVDMLLGKSHILFVDADGPGERLEAELARRLGKGNCKIVRLPQGFKDANEYLMAAGSANLKLAVESAQPIPVDGIYHGNQITDDVVRLFGGGFTGGVSTGYSNLDGLFSIRKGEWTVVTGIPNHGKSNFVDCLLVNTAKEHGWQWAVFSPENQPIARHAAGLIEKATSHGFTKADMTTSDVQGMMGWIDQHFHWILPGMDDSWSLDSILEMASTLVERNGINGLVIDPWNELDHQRPHALSETEYISKCLTKVRRFARLHDIHIFLIAHPAKLYKDKQGQYPVPTPYDISGSAHWRNKADNALTIYRDFYSQPSTSMNRVEPIQPVQCHVQKVRFKEVGAVGMAEFRFERRSSTYIPITGG